MLERRKFLAAVGAIAAGAAISFPLKAAISTSVEKLKVVLIGTGIRGNGFWGKSLIEKYGDVLEFVGLVDHNESRLKYAAKFIDVGKNCGLYTNFGDMIAEQSPDLIMVTTTDATHHIYIIKSLASGVDVLTEKPMTTDEDKCQEILDAERKYKRKVIVTFNYRWSPYNTKIKELLTNKTIGDVVSVDFSWMLNTSHGASYFRRWHGQREHSGTLLVHKSTHHFDLINWWLDSDPAEVFAYGDLEFYGGRPEKKGVNCRNCDEKNSCKFYWDITKSKDDYERYVKHEHVDGYIRDNCLFRPEINIYDKMNVNIKYANNVFVNYMLTTYSPWEGWRVAFNGTKGRLEAFLDVPYLDANKLSQEELHAAEMNQQSDGDHEIKPIISHKLWEEQETVYVPYSHAGHGGGDTRLHDQIFVHPEKDDVYKHMAGTRDGAMSVLIGIAARKSIESGKPVRIAGLTHLHPRAKRI
ncbi:gfo/Idh/MocA family oxidoreductase [Maribellus luteus]|uniref:Gfo/Idh/MocA family oxidoreductase n=1 Tax=Maribellus luteus TaxID=2305463 RepID=A0A399T9E8_9BACT|nr:Gfo/Idh/MocA family oxidoreductase [Maribellus luteus]RIJ50553.1 gfo/Idh/MocA family oxidoreductase [Maribellus luteus]